MSTVIDERVVEMRFDNKQFESGVSTTITSLDKLKQKLNLTGATKGLSEIDSASKKVNMSALGSAVDTVAAKFSAMQVIGVTALANLTTSAYNAGMNIAKSLTIDPIKSGFSEYETQINAVQTILSNTKNKGSTLDDVNEALDELNTYADKTIYNFTQMTKNIGTFTAAGVDLDKSVSSIKGIANLAAVSGSSSQQASTAMYQLSQALAAGRVSLMDWNSVVNAGMGGQLFQDALIRTSEVLGTGAKAAIESYGSFRESLTQGKWLTTEVLTETLSQLAGAYSEADLLSKGYTAEQTKQILELANDAEEAATKVKTFTQLFDTLKETSQSGWTQTWELLVGDYEEAKTELTKINDVLGEIIGNSAESRNTMLEGALMSNWGKMTKKINEAGIQTATFENKVREVAEAHNIDVSAMVKEHGSLSEAFKNGAISSDILREAVAGLSGGLVDLQNIERDLKKGSSGDDVKKVQEALKALEYDLGKAGADGLLGKDTEAAIKAFQEASGLEVTGIVNEETIKALQAATSTTKNLSTEVGGLIDNITVLGGRELLFKSLWNVFDGLLSVIKPIGQAFRNIFPATTAEQLYGFIERFEIFTGKMKLNDVQGDQLRRTFEGLFAVIDIGKEFVLALVDGFSGLTGYLAEAAQYILDNSAAFGDWLVKLRDAVKEGDIFSKGISYLVKMVSIGLAKASSTITGFIEGVKNVGRYLKENLDFSGFESMHEGLAIMYQRLCDIDQAAKNAGGAVVGSIMAIDWSPLLKTVQYIIDAVKSLWNGIATVLSKVDYNEVADIISSGLFAGLLTSITSFFKQAKSTVSEVAGIFTNIKDILEGVKDTLVAYQQDLKANTLLKIASAVAILAGSLMLLSLIDSDKMSTSLGALGSLIGSLLTSVSIISAKLAKNGKISLNIRGIANVISLMIGISVAVAILAAALKSISGLKPEEMLTGVAGILGLCTALALMMADMSVFGQEAIKGAGGLIVAAIAVKILASACLDLSGLNWQQLVTGLAGVGALLAELAIFLALTNKFGGDLSVKSAVGIVILAASLKILASATKDFGSMSVEELAKGVISIGALLGILGLFVNGAGKAEHVMASGVSLIAIGAAMKIFASAVKDFGSMSVEELAKGLISMSVALAAVTIALKFMPANMISIGVGMIAVSAALKIMASAVGDFGGMSVAEIAKGLITLGVSMGILAFALNSMTGALPGAAALLVATGALALLAPVLAFLGAMSLGSIVKSLGAIAGAFLILGIAGTALTPLVPTIAALCGSLALLGLGMALVGVGVLAIGTGLTAIAAGLTALIAVLPAGAVVIVAALKEVIVGILGIIPAALKKFGAIITTFCDVIIEAAPAIAEAFKSLVLAGITVLTECIAPAADGLLQFLSQLLESLGEYTPQIVDGLFQFILGLLEGLVKYIPDFIVAMMDIVGAVVQGVIDALSMMDGGGLLGAIATIGLIGAIIVGLSFLGGFIPGAMVALAGLGILAVELAAILAILGGLAQIPGLKWLIGEGGDLLQAIGTAIGQFVGGIIGGIAEGATSTLPQVGKNLSEFMENANGFITGMQNVDSGLADKVSVLCKSIIALAGADLVSSLASIFTGDSSLTDLGAQMAKFGGYIKKYADSVTSVNSGAINTAINEVKKLMKLAKDADGVDFDKLSDFGEALGDMAKAGVKEFVEAFEDAHDQATEAGDSFVGELITAMEERKDDTESIGEALANACASAIRDKATDFYKAGAYLVTGFCSGITQNIYQAKAKAKAMAAAAAEAARKELDEHSPSRVGYEIGDFFGVAFVNGIADNIKRAYNVSTSMADQAKSGLSEVISTVSDFINGDMDVQPTIRPVLDLSDVSSGVRSMDGMLNNSSIGVMSNIGSISRAMNLRQNGNEDVVSAINRLNKALGNLPTGTVNNINGITYSSGDEISDAINVLIRKTVMDGRA